MDRLNAESIQQVGRGRVATARPSEFEQLARRARRHLRLFLWTALVVISAVMVVVMTRPPRYTSTATILINQRTPDVLHLNSLTPGDAQEQAFVADSSAVDTQVEVLRSRALAAEVVDQFHLDRDPEFGGGQTPSPATPSPSGSPSGLAQEEQRQRIVNAVMGSLDVKRTGLTYAINVTFTAYEPDKAAALANAFVQAYLTNSVDSQTDSQSSATTWLDTRLSQLKGEMEAADVAVQQYKIANNLMSAAGTTLTEQEITQFDGQLAQARADEAQQDARLETAEEQLRAGSNGADVAASLSDPVIQTLTTQRALASSQLADLQSRYGDKYPDVVKAQRTLADLDQQIQNEIERVLSSLKAQSFAAHTRTKSLEASALRSKASLAGDNRAIVRLNQLQTADDSAKAIYEAFLARYKETVAKAGNQSPTATVASAARIPTSAAFPSKKLGLAIAVVLGFFAGAVAVIIAELLRTGVSSGTEAAETFDLPTLGELPTLVSTLHGKDARRFRRDPVGYVAAKPLSRFAEAFRRLRASLIVSRVGVNVKVVALTSALPSEGKTTAAICLARMMAISGSNVILVDCDLRQRAVNRLLKSEPSAGLMEVLNGTASLEQAIVRDAETGLWLLPLARSSFTPRDVLGSAQMSRLLEQLRSRFDFVVIDTAPVLAVAETQVLCSKVDAVVMLVRWRKTPRKAAIAALRLLNPDETFVAGIALSMVNLKEQARLGEGVAAYERAYRKYYTG